MVEEIIQKFVESQNQIEQLITENKSKEAQEKYKQTLDIYHQIQNSNLQSFHKELAYEQITDLFKKIKSSKPRKKIPYNLVLAAILLIAFGTMVLLKPSIVGLVAYEETIRQPVELNFEQSGTYQIKLQDRPVALMASGEYEGKAKLYYRNGEKLELIVDTEKIEGNTFKDICEETCTMIATDNNIEIFAKIEEGWLKINEISYKIQINENIAPKWKGPVSFNARNEETLTINLDEYYEDTDKLVYLSTTAEGLEVIIQHNNIKIKPKTTGTKEIVLIASDLKEITRTPIKIEVN